MEKSNLIPLNLQFFADDSEDTSADSLAEAADETEQTSVPEPKHKQARKPVDMDVFAATLMKAVENRSQRAERSTIHSLAEQYGMQEDELSKMLENAKAEKAKRLPPEVQQQLDQITQSANTKLIAAEVKTVGTAMGLLDADAALVLMDKSGVKVDQNGAVSGMKEALDALKNTKPYLFKLDELKPTGAKADVGGKVVQSGAPAITKEQFDKMGYASRLALKQKNPQLYEYYTKREE